MVQKWNNFQKKEIFLKKKTPQNKPKKGKDVLVVYAKQTTTTNKKQKIVLKITVNTSKQKQKNATVIFLI